LGWGVARDGLSEEEQLEIGSTPPLGSLPSVMVVVLLVGPLMVLGESFRLELAFLALGHSEVELFVVRHVVVGAGSVEVIVVGIGILPIMLGECLRLELALLALGHAEVELFVVGHVVIGTGSVEVAIVGVSAALLSGGLEVNEVVGVLLDSPVEFIVDVHAVVGADGVGVAIIAILGVGLSAQAI